MLVSFGAATRRRVMFGGHYDLYVLDPDDRARGRSSSAMPASRSSTPSRSTRARIRGVFASALDEPNGFTIVHDGQTGSRRHGTRRAAARVTVVPEHADGARDRSEARGVRRLRGAPADARRDVVRHRRRQRRERQPSGKVYVRRRLAPGNVPHREPTARRTFRVPGGMPIVLHLSDDERRRARSNRCRASSAKRWSSRRASTGTRPSRAEFFNGLCGQVPQRRSTRDRWTSRVNPDMRDAGVGNVAARTASAETPAGGIHATCSGRRRGGGGGAAGRQRGQDGPGPSEGRA